MERWLAKQTWDRLFVYLLFLLLAGPPLANWLLPFKVRKAHFLYLALLVIAIKLLAAVPPALRRYRAAGAEGTAAQWKALFPPTLGGWIRMDKGYWHAFFAWVQRRPALPPLPPGQPIGYLHKSQYTTVLAMVFISCLADLPVSAMIIGVVEQNPVIRFRIHAVMLALTLYSLVWVLADRWLVKASHHVLGQTHLHLRVGSRFTADIPLEAIVDAVRLGEPARQWSERLGIAREDYMKVSPFDAPNVLLTLTGDPALLVERFKTVQRAPTYLLVFVDDPACLAQLLKRRPGAVCVNA
ncbi:MAG: hypothetical protein V4857_20190 [Pseudomonadota bacterium]